MSGCHEIFCGDAKQGFDWVFELVGGVNKCKRVPEPAEPYAWFVPDPNPAFVGDRIELDGSSSTPSAGTVTSHRWDLDGDGQFDDHSGPRTSVSFSQPGEYDVSLRIRDSEGKRGRMDTEINVLDPVESPPPIAVIDASATTVTPGTTVRFDGSRSYDPKGQQITRHEWDPDGDGYYQSGATSTEYTYTQPGTFTARLRVTDSDELAAVAEQPIVVSNVMEAKFTISDNPAPIGKEIIFDASGSTGPIRTYEWNLDGNPGYEVTESDPVTTKTYEGERYGEGREVTIQLRVSNEARDIFATAEEKLTFTSAIGPGGLRSASVFPPRPRPAAGLPFKARLEGRTYGRHDGRLRISRRKASVVGRAMIGRLRGSLGRGAGGDPLGDLLPAVWIGRIKMSASRGGRRVTVRGLAHATFERAPGTACLRFRLRSRGRRRTGTLVATGGTGDGAQLAARARFRWRVGRTGAVRLRGTIARRGVPQPPSPRCRALRSLRP
jgi:PKD repeat protein